MDDGIPGDPFILIDIGSHRFGSLTGYIEFPTFPAQIGISKSTTRAIQLQRDTRGWVLYTRSIICISANEYMNESVEISIARHQHICRVYCICCLHE